MHPEDSPANGSLEVNLQTKEITSYILPDGYEWCENHIAHAKWTLIEIYESNQIPEEKTVAWY